VILYGLAALCEINGLVPGEMDFERNVLREKTYCGLKTKKRKKENALKICNIFLATFSFLIYLRRLLS